MSKIQLMIIGIIVLVSVGVGTFMLATHIIHQTGAVITPTPQVTLTLSPTMQAMQTTTPTTMPQPSTNKASYEGKIAACYPANPDCSACSPILNNSIQHVAATERRFVNTPKDIYPMEDISSQFVTVKGNATAGYVSNGGLPGKGMDAAPGCYSTYYEFDGEGEVDLRVKSPINDVPDYFVRFIVTPPQ